MIFSKANLVAVEASRADKGIATLDNLHFLADGGTVAASGSTVLAVSPVNSDALDKVPLNSTRMTDAETVNSETVREVLKGMPKDSLFAGTLEHCDYAFGKFILTDGKRHRTVTARTYPREYIDYREIFSRVKGCSVVHRSVVNLRRLVDLLGVIDKMFPDSSKNSAVFLEFTSGKDVVVRVREVRGRQRCIGIIKAYDGDEGKWLERDSWEEELCGSSENVSARKIIKKKRSK